jgi:hypothetical protein
MISKICSVVVCSALALMLAAPAQATVTAYDNLGTAATAGYSEPNTNAPIFGDSLALVQGGPLAGVGFSLYNSSSGGNTGAILAGTMELKIYDNTAPYGGGALSLPLLATFDFGLDLTSGGGLAPGFYSIFTADVTSANITVPQNILVTQQFTQTSGTSTRNGFILFSDPVAGTSPNTVYLKSGATAEGLYTFTGNPGQVGFQITIVPEPATMVLAGLGIAGALLRRRR